MTFETVFSAEKWQKQHPGVGVPEWVGLRDGRPAKIEGLMAIVQDTTGVEHLVMADWVMIKGRE